VEEKKWLWTILFIALIVRAMWIVCLPNQPVSDGAVYNSLGWKLASGQGYFMFSDNHGQPIPTAFWPVGYPFFLSILYSLFGHRIIVAKIANLLFGVVTIALVYFLSRRMFNPIVAKLTSGMLTFWPNLIAYTNLSVTEPIFTLILVLLVSLVILPRERLSKLQQVGAGCVLGYGALVKPALLPFAAVLLIILTKKYRSWSSAFSQTALIIVVMVVTIFPWTMRNYFTFGKVIPVATTMGFNLWAGNNPEATGTYMIPEQLAVNPFQTSLRENEIEYNKRGMELGTKYILAHPFRFITNGLKKMFFIYSRDNSAINWTFRGVEFRYSRHINLAVNIINQGYYTIVLMLFILYLIAEFKNFRQLFLIENSGLLIVFYFSAIYFVFFGDDRFHIPFIPFMAMYASVVLEKVIFRYRVALIDDRFPIAHDTRGVSRRMGSPDTRSIHG
jgi:4-amino-4-deoxy-L-arabinose transferase-like glycosyltransferase